MRKIIFYTEAEGGFCNAIKIKETQKELIQKLKKGYSNNNERRYYQRHASLITITLLWDNNPLIDFPSQSIKEMKRTLLIHSVFFPNGRIFDSFCMGDKDWKYTKGWRPKEIGYKGNKWERLVAEFDLHPNGGTMTQIARGLKI